MAETCLSCKEDRAVKGLPPMDRIQLPLAVTPKSSFRHPKIPTYVCPYCDGETLISTALKSLKERQGK